MSGRVVAFRAGDAALTLDLDSGAVGPDPVNPHAKLHGLSSGSAHRGPVAGAGDREPGRAAPAVDPRGNVVLRSTADGRAVPLTTDGTGEIQWRVDYSDPALGWSGTGLPVANSSPDGGRIAASRVDLRGVGQMPKIHHLKRSDEVVSRYAAKAGGMLERMTLHVLDTYGRPPVQIDLGDPADRYPAHAAWFSSGQELLVFTLSRDCLRADVYIADANTGQTGTCSPRRARRSCGSCTTSTFGRSSVSGWSPARSTCSGCRTAPGQAAIPLPPGRKPRPPADRRGRAGRLRPAHRRRVRVLHRSQRPGPALRPAPAPGAARGRAAGTAHRARRPAHRRLRAGRRRVRRHVVEADQPPVSVLRRADGTLLARSRPPTAAGWTRAAGCRRGSSRTAAADGRPSCGGRCTSPTASTPAGPTR